MQQIADWLKKLDMPEYHERFAKNHIDISVLRHLTDRDLRELGISLGHRRKMLAAIAELSSAIPAAPQTALAEAEVHRLAAAEAHFHTALDAARCQSAKFWELRAASTRLWRDQGNRIEARDLLAPVYGWFTEGLDMPVLKQAKSLLDFLS
jgi:hypothetical protein